MAKKKAQPAGLRNGEILINDDNYRDFEPDQAVAGETKARGLIPRNYAKYPVGCYASAVPFDSVDMPLIPRSEWSARIKEKIAVKSQLSDLRLVGNAGQAIPSRDQNGRGYCWMHSGVSTALLLRTTANLPYADLSAYACACIIKNYRDEGGWGAQGLDFLMARGVPTSKFWPQKSVARSNDTPACWENARLHRITEGWIDLQAAQYDRTLTFDQVATCLLLNVPVIVDYNWWSHSVCAMDLVEVSSGSFGIRIWNSWGDGWSDRGMGVLEGSKAIPDGATAPRSTTPSVD